VPFDVIIRAKRLRATDSTSATPILMLTTCGTSSDRVAGLEDYP
jgi:DNA-binding response OmpR family regulator